jgi:hypothetical protein
MSVVIGMGFEDVKPSDLKKESMNVDFPSPLSPVCYMSELFSKLIYLSPLP